MSKKKTYSNFLNATNAVIREAKDIQTLANNLVIFVEEGNNRGNQCKTSIYGSINALRNNLVVLEGELKELMN